MLKAFFYAFVGFVLSQAVMRNDVAKCDNVSKSYMERLTDN